jgi:hypothetical protein
VDTLTLSNFDDYYDYFRTFCSFLASFPTYRQHHCYANFLFGEPNWVYFGEA